MRILQISSARALGGGERHFADLARGLARRGHTVSVALRHGSPLREELSHISDDCILTLPLRNAIDIKSAVGLARFAREHEIEIIHAHAARDYPLAAFAARRTGASLCITRHVLFPMSRAHTLILKGVARVIAVSEPVARSLASQKIFPESKIRVVENGIDTARLERISAEMDKADYRRSLGVRASLVVGVLGELSEVKGQEDFVRAASLVTMQMRDVEFLIVGEEGSRSGKTRTAIETLIDELGLKERVHLLGRRDDAAEVLSCLDVFVSASRSEAFGLATVEAMACGATVVATDTEGSREVVEDGTTGLLVRVSDHQALADAILRLLRDESLRARLIEGARLRARARWSLERMLDETERVYFEALSETN